MEMQELVFSCGLFLMMLFTVTNGQTKHCYVCKSRGAQGDCKDPYTGEAAKLNIQPCFTGWCMKILDTEENFPATERTCMPNPPSDSSARCTSASRELPGFPPKKVYVCYCNGDLCNSAHPLRISVLLPFVCVVLIAVSFWYN